MTGASTRLTTVVLTATIILAIALAAGGFAATAAAQQDPGEEPTYELEIANDGEPHAIGFPGPINGTINDTFADGFDGVESIFAYQDGSWERLEWADFDETPAALDAIVVTTSGSGPATIPLEVTFATNVSASDQNVSAGWNMVSATSFTDSQDSFGDGVNESLLVLDRYEGVSSSEMPAVGSFPDYVIDSDQWSGAAPNVSPFSGYFVYFDNPSSISSTVTDIANKSEADALLGLDTFDPAPDPELDLTATLDGSALTDGETIANGTAPGLLVEVTHSNGTTEDVTSVDVLESSDTSVITIESGFGATTAQTQAEGSATISAEYDVDGTTLTDNLTLTVGPAVLDTYSIDTLADISTADEAPASVTSTLTNGSTEDVSDLFTLASNNTSVVSVDQAGDTWTIVGESAGTTELTATGQNTTVTSTINATAPTMEFSAGDVDGSPGFSAAVPIEASSLDGANHSLESYDITFSYDDSVLEPTGVTAGSIDASNGTATITGAPSLGGAPSHDLTTVEFDVDDNASLNQSVPIAFDVSASSAIETPGGFGTDPVPALPAWSDGSVSIVEAQVGTVAGTVTNESGVPIEDVEVSTEDASTTTNATGDYELVLESGNYTLSYAHTAHLDDSQNVSVAADTTTSGDIELREIDLTGYVEGDDGYLDTNATNENVSAIEFTESEDYAPTEEALNQSPDYLPDPGAITMEAAINESDGTWTGDVDFPVSISEDVNDLLGDIYVEAEIATVDGATGTINETSGEMTLDTEVDISVAVYGAEHGTDWEDRGSSVVGDECHIPNAALNATTGTSGNMTGEALDANDTAVLVGNDFPIAGAQDCGGLASAINGAQGIPTAAGDAEVLFDWAFDFGAPEEPEPEPELDLTATLDGNELSDGETIANGTAPGLSAEVTHPNGTTEDVTSVDIINSSDTGVITIESGFGAPTAQTQDEGSATISAEYDVNGTTLTDSLSLTVGPAVLDTYSIDTLADISTADEAPASVTSTLTNGSTEGVSDLFTLASNNTSVVSVDQAGDAWTIVGESAGTTELEATGQNTTVTSTINATAPTMEFSAGDVDGSPGFSAAVPIEASSLDGANHSLESYDITFTYDESVLEPTGVTVGSLTAANGTATITGAPSLGGAPSHDLTTVEFAVDDNASLNQSVPIAIDPVASSAIETPGGFGTDPVPALPAWSDGSVSVQAAETGTVAGTVTNESGAIEGVTVSTEEGTTQTDSTGNYLLELQTGNHTITYAHDDHLDDSQNVSVALDSTTNADIELREIDLTGYVEGEEGYLHTNATNENVSAIEFTESEDYAPTEEALNQSPDYLPDPEAITMEAAINESAGTWTGDVDFPASISERNQSGIGELYVEAQIDTVGGASGTINETTGEFTLDTEVDISIAVYLTSHGTPWEDRGSSLVGDECHIPNVALTTTTGTSGNMTGEPIDANDTASMVGNEFAIDGAQDCGGLAGVINGAQGIPTNASDAEVLFDFAFDFGAPEEPEPTVESIDLSLDETTVNESETTNATVMANYDDNTTNDVTDEATLSSDNTSVATVDNGTVTAASAGMANITADFDGQTDTIPVTVESTEIPIPDFESFTAYGMEGQISIGTSLTQTLSACQFGEPWPENESAECISVIGSANTSNGTYATEPTPGVNFPAVMAMGLVPVQINVPDGFTGDLDPETGTMSVNGPVEVLIAPYQMQGSCGLDIDLSADTGTSGNETGSPLEMVGPNTAEVTVVNGTFSVPAIQDGCGGDEATFNGILGLPSASGANNISLTLQVELSENETDVVTEDLTLENPFSGTNLSTTLDPGETANVSAIGWFEHRASHEVTTDATWSSSDPGVVSINETTEAFTPNLLTAESSGTAEITATYDGQSASVNITVNETEPTLESIDLALDDSQIDAGNTTGAAVTANYDDNTSEDVTANATISSDDSGIASVSGATVSGVAGGTVNITADYDNQSDSAQLTVTEDPAQLESIDLALDDSTITENGSTNATVTANYDDNSSEDVTTNATITSSNTTVATVSNSEVTAGSAGQTTIDATYDGETANTTLTVEANTTTVTGNVSYNPPIVNATVTVEGTGLSDVTDSNGTFTIENVPIGTYNISVTHPNYTDAVATDMDLDGSGSLTIDFEIERTLDDLNVTLADSEIDIGNSTTATVTATFANGDVEDVTANATLSSLDPAIATVSNGSVSGVAAGGASVEATYGTAFDTASLTVIDDAEPLPSSFSAYVLGDSAYLATNTSDPAASAFGITECEDGQPTEAALNESQDYLPDPGCISANGTIDHEDNSWEGNITFPTLYVEETVSGLPIYAQVNLSATNVGGTFDYDSGEITIDALVDIGVRVYQISSHGDDWADRGEEITDSTCTVPDISLSPTTESSFVSASNYTEENETIAGQRLNESGYAQVVTNGFQIDGAQGCGDLGGSINLNTAINDTVGAPSSDTELAFDLDLSFDSQ